jgi:hypothetical protein
MTSFCRTVFHRRGAARALASLSVNLEIVPEPNDAERAAIAAALEAEAAENEQAGPSRWAKREVPVHDGHDEPHP